MSGVRGEAPGDLAVLKTHVNPYQGLKAFGVEQALFFFGREAVTEWLLDAIRPKRKELVKSRFIAVVGPSGSGKSSIAKAGLIAQLTSGAIEGSQHWPILQMRADGDPIETLAMSLDDSPKRKLSPKELRDLIADMISHDDGLHKYTMRSIRGSPDQRLVILVDQFEEVFAGAERETQRAHFIDNLLYAVSEVTGQVIVVITMRSDFYGRCAAYPQLAHAISEHAFLVGPMSDRELNLAIEQPAHRAGVEFEPGLAQQLIDDFKQQANGLPLLQFTLYQLWERCNGGLLTHAAYETKGRMSGCRSHTAPAQLMTKRLHGVSTANI